MSSQRNRLGQRIETIAHETFGYERLHPGQKDAIEAVVGGRDTLVVMPTGAGKSAIYQIAAQFLDGPVVVVSPLIALQRDQVASINSHVVGEAAVVNSTIRAAERREAFAALEEDALTFLFLAPEQFHNEQTLAHV